MSAADGAGAELATLGADGEKKEVANDVGAEKDGAEKEGAEKVDEEVALPAFEGLPRDRKEL